MGSSSGRQLNLQFLYGIFTCIGVSSLTGGKVCLRFEHTLPPVRLHGYSVTDFTDPQHQKSQAKLPLPMPCRHRRRGTAMLILKLSNGWRWDVIFTPWLLYLLQKYQASIEQEAALALEPVSTLWKKRKLSCNCQELMNSLISSTGHSSVILTKLSHLNECYTHTKIHWLPHKQIHFHRGTFGPGYIHTPIYTESTVAPVMLPPIFYWYTILTSDQNSSAGEVLLH